MEGDPPAVYLLNGDDEFAIAEFLSEMEARLGDPAAVAMNVTHLDGNTYNPDELLLVTSAMPFLAERRLVTLTNPLARLKSPPARKKFLERLEQVPRSTALVLIEYRLLTSERDRRAGKLHWLEKWAASAGDRVYVKLFSTPKGAQMGDWIRKQASRLGGEFTPQAASLLAALVDGDPRSADQEIFKLLAYVNYQRPVEIDDVENLTPDAASGDIFVLVDSLGHRNGRKAMGMLHRLLEQQEPNLIFGMVVRQFRLLLLAREVLDRGGNKGDIARELKIIQFVGDKLYAQARHFTLVSLEEIHHRLLELDEAVKTSQMPPKLALDTLVAELTSSQSGSYLPR